MYPCKWGDCQQQFEELEVLYTHLSEAHVGRKIHNTLILKCNWSGCNVEYTKRDHMTSHLRKHVPLKPFLCPICSRGFKRPQDLKKHDKLHDPDRFTSSVGGGNSTNGVHNGQQERPRDLHNPVGNAMSKSSSPPIGVGMDRSVRQRVHVDASSYLGLELPSKEMRIVSPLDLFLSTLKSRQFTSPYDEGNKERTHVMSFPPFVGTEFLISMNPPETELRIQLDTLATDPSIFPDSLSSASSQSPTSSESPHSTMQYRTDYSFLDSFSSQELSSLNGFLVNLETEVSRLLPPAAHSTSSVNPPPPNSDLYFVSSQMLPLSMLAMTAAGRQPSLPRVVQHASTQKRSVSPPRRPDPPPSMSSKIRICDLLNSDEDEDMVCDDDDGGGGGGGVGGDVRKLRHFEIVRKMRNEISMELDRRTK
ncbi:hypothetical protein HDU98_001905 [Podochytrium sp. JEL0797]|nr:hypothetical protein HDU98_001905 [Podochytrium sp. JEL0797]